MSSFNISGLDGVIATLESHADEKKLNAATNHMLNAGAKIMRQEMQQAMKEAKLKDSGDMIKSVKSGGIKYDKNGEKYVEVRPRGYDRKGNPNNLKARIAEFGNSKRPARPWLSKAENKGFPKVQERMQEIFDEHMNKE